MRPINYDRRRRRRLAARMTVTPGPHSTHAVMLRVAAILREARIPEAHRRYLNFAKQIRLGAPRLP
jgi:hypothetical protein